MNALKAVASIFMGVLFSLAGDYYMKIAGSPWSRAFGFGLIAHFVACLPLWLSYRFASFSGCAVLWQVEMVAVSITLAVVRFGERLTVYKLIALAFLALALCFTMMDESSSELAPARNSVRTDAAATPKAL